MLAQKGEAHQRVRDPALGDDECSAGNDARDKRDHHGRRGPSPDLGLGQAEHEPDDRDREQRRARDVDPRSFARGGSGGTARRAATTANTASGTLTRSTARQLNTPVRTPPIVGPSAPATAAIPPMVPNARPRSSAENAALTIATVLGSISAPPTPWATRQAKRIGKLGASPPSAEAPAKSMQPSMKILRRPSMSPSRPPSTSSPARGADSRSAPIAPTAIRCQSPP